LAKKSIKSRIRKLLRSPKLLLIFSIILVLTATLLFANKGLWRHAKLRSEISSQQAKQKQLDDEQKILSKQVDQLKSEDPATIERIAREKYNMKRPGETIYRDSQ
jgi:cell division protein FtsB